MMPLARVGAARLVLAVLPALCLAAALLAAFAFVNLALAFSFPPLTGRVVDSANIIPPAVSDRISPKLASLEAKSGIQLVVATVKSLEGDDIEPYANALFRAWKLGEKQKNNGVLLLVAPNERKARIEVGYGLEGTLTDALSKIIITNAMAPRFKAGDFGGGIERGVDDIITVLTTDSSEWEKRPELRIVRQDTTLDALGPWIALGLFVFIFFWLTPPRQRGNLLSFLLGMLMSSGRGGGYRGGSGGWSAARAAVFPAVGLVGRRRRLGELVMAHLSAEDQRRVGDAIKAAEATTAGEIVCVLARASSDYMSCATAWSALIALIAPWFLIALTNFSVHEILLAQIVIFVVLFVILSELSLHRFLIPRARAARTRIVPRWNNS